MTGRPRPISDIDIAVLRAGAIAHPWTGETAVPPAQHRVVEALTEPERPTSISFTYDIGYHASGWWANADYDRCWHLSLAHLGEGTELVQIPGDLQLVPRRKLETCSDDELKAWATRIFGVHARLAWVEPAAARGDPHRLPNIAHIRVFTDPTTGAPFQPTGEVYHLRPLDGLSPAKVIDGRLGADVR